MQYYFRVEDWAACQPKQKSRASCLYSLTFLEKPSEKPRTCPLLNLTGHRNGTFRPIWSSCISAKFTLGASPAPLSDGFRRDLLRNPYRAFCTKPTGSYLSASISAPSRRGPIGCSRRGSLAGLQTDRCKASIPGGLPKEPRLQLASAQR